MTDENIPSISATLSVPDGQGTYISSKVMIARLEVFQKDIADMIERLDKKQQGEKIALKFDLDLHHHGIRTGRDIEKCHTKITPIFYCNGPG